MVDPTFFHTSRNNTWCFVELQVGSGASSLGYIQFFASWPKLLREGGLRSVGERLGFDSQAQWGVNQLLFIGQKTWEGVPDKIHGNPQRFDNDFLVFVEGLLGGFVIESPTNYFGITSLSKSPKTWSE